jgi:thiamine pyrophosphate-dependent acetolactate synthase large subunit-like protein
MENLSLGVTNTVTAVKNAQLAESPVLLLAGAAPSLYKGRGALQVFASEKINNFSFF